MSEAKRNFDTDAAQWDENPGRVKLTNAIADKIIEKINPNNSQTVLDFGCGTGLLSLRIAPLVKHLTGLDSSQGMLDVLAKKAEALGHKNVDTLFLDISGTEVLDRKFDLITSAMALHHVKETVNLLRKFHDALNLGGHCAITDLDTEDGSFHGDNSAGVFHKGFDRNELCSLFREAGFTEVKVDTAIVMRRLIADGSEKEFSIFLITATK